MQAASGRLPPRLASELVQDAGVEVVDIVEGSPAARAGMRSEDLIVSSDGVPVRRIEDLLRSLTPDRIGSRVTLKLIRGGRLLQLDLVPVELGS